jgi:formylglycine-generating enzyme required for sulfatase activity/predicted esterase
MACSPQGRIIARVEGTRLSHYTIVAKIGEGGMGAVYRAVDSRLNRTVAIKVLPSYASADPDRRRRFVQEAQSASALNHPNIVSIHDIDCVDGIDFIAMEYVDGAALGDAIAGAPLSIDTVVDYAVQMAAALAAAHDAGIVHRDIKPGNTLVSRSGLVKVVDFGLAKLIHTDAPSPYAATQTATPASASGLIIGTAAYMSPEQAEGLPVDARTDVFSFGAVLYEMLTGTRAFQGRSPMSVMAAVLHEHPAPVRALRVDIPSALEHIVSRCLEKDPQKRYASGKALLADLQAYRASAAGAPAVRRGLTRPMVAGIVAVALLAAAVIAWGFVRSSRARWARNVALPQIEAMVARAEPDAAYRLLQRVKAVIPDDPQVTRLSNDVNDPVSLVSEPPGASVSTKSYLDPAGDWIPLGTTPLQNALVPFGFRRWRIAKEGYETRELASGMRIPAVALTRAGDTPAGMVLVSARGPASETSPAPLANFWIDKYEVSNRDFKAFVDAGGYTNPAYWTQAFIKDGREISRDEAMRALRDSTGRPGPAGWELSTYPEGQADLPVTGVSWYEAAAYAAYAHKSLPTYFHWYQAAAQGIYSEILLLSNFSGKQLAKVGEYRGLGAYGTFDMAGNAKEWCFNNVGSRRFILGGAWNEPAYMYTDKDAQDPFARLPNYGFRCARYVTPPSTALLAPVEPTRRDYSQERPIADDAFRIVQSLYAYDRTPLNATVEPLADDSPYWRREKITIDAAYGKERVPALLFLPRNAAPPFQTVVFFPSGNAFSTRSTAYLETRQIQFVVQSGRAVLFPVYKGSFDRWVGLSGVSEMRDLYIQWVKDFRRSVDYLETRPDIDSSRLGYYGISTGAVVATSILAIDHRVKAAVLLGGAFPLERELPEVDPINFTSRISVPVLMLNGRYDFEEPVETSQKPMFESFATPPDRKRHVLFETGHAIVQIQPMIKEILDWYDAYLGPVRTQSPR